MPQTIYIISDLHLGGAIAREGLPDFRMCSDAGQARLVEFLLWVAGKATQGNVHLVLAGDIVDFLAEQDFVALTVDEKLACDKLAAILKRTETVWAAVREVLRHGRVSLILGNHDPELCFPGPRRLLLETLGAGRIEFLYDNQAFSIGDVLVEHGNQYDRWNVIPPDALRRVRSRLSRGLSAEPGLQVPGSELVVQVMNDIKATHSWVDLLKPETHAVFPLLVALKPDVLLRLNKIAGLYVRSLRAYVNQGWQIGGATATDDEKGRLSLLEEERALEDALALAASLVGAPDPSQISADQWLTHAKKCISATVQDIKDESLYQALKFFAKSQIETFALDREVKRYLQPANQAIKRGFRVVVFGHTHLARQVPLFVQTKGIDEKMQSMYLNTGTWADIIRMPPEIFSQSGDIGKKTMVEFCQDLKFGRVSNWRKQVPSYARIELDDELRAHEPRLLFFRDRYAPELEATGNSLWDFAV